MFESKSSHRNTENTPAQIRQVSNTGEPIEFVYNGVRFHINQTLTTWLQSSRWWQQVDQFDLTQTGLKEEVIKYWQVEAAPVGAITTFEIQFNQVSNTWQIRPSSRSKG
jgi:hypothetical protein